MKSGEYFSRTRKTLSQSSIYFLLIIIVIQQYFVIHKIKHLKVQQKDEEGLITLDLKKCQNNFNISSNLSLNDSNKNILKKSCDSLSDSTFNIQRQIKKQKPEINYNNRMKRKNKLFKSSNSISNVNFNNETNIFCLKSHDQSQILSRNELILPEIKQNISESLILTETNKCSNKRRVIMMKVK